MELLLRIPKSRIITESSLLIRMLLSWSRWGTCWMLLLAARWMVYRMYSIGQTYGVGKIKRKLKSFGIVKIIMNAEMRHSCGGIPNTTTTTTASVWTKRGKPSSAIDQATQPCKNLSINTLNPFNGHYTKYRVGTMVIIDEWMYQHTSSALLTNGKLDHQSEQKKGFCRITITHSSSI